MRPAALAEIARCLQQITGPWTSVESLAGGDISAVYLVNGGTGKFVLKTQDNPPPGFFASEAAGLSSLAERGVAVPTVFALAESYLLLDYFPPAAGDFFAAGVMLARLHEQPCKSYGAESDNYLATILQPNRASADWADYFIKHRLNFCLERISALAPKDRQRWQSFARAVHPLLATCPRPSWLHGDLWAGNLLMSTQGPVFIDPACYAGDALVDLAMTRLFGGFPQQFYEGYRSVVPAREHEAELIRIYQLYPLLVHAILFDAGNSRNSAYYRRAAELRDSFF